MKKIVTVWKNCIYKYYVKTFLSFLGGLMLAKMIKATQEFYPIFVQYCELYSE